MEKLTAWSKLIAASVLIVVLVYMLISGRIEIDTFMKYAMAVIGMIQMLDGVRLLTRNGKG